MTRELCSVIVASMTQFYDHIDDREAELVLMLVRLMKRMGWNSHYERHIQAEAESIIEPPEGMSHEL